MEMQKYSGSVFIWNQTVGVTALQIRNFWESENKKSKIKVEMSPIQAHFLYGKT